MAKQNSPQRTSKNFNVASSGDWSKRLVSQIKRYMIENSIPRVKIDGDEALVLEPISHGERAMWIKMWLAGELSTKQLLKEIKDYVKCRFQWSSWDTDDFLRAVKDVKKRRQFDFG